MSKAKKIREDEIETKLTRVVDIIDAVSIKLPSDFYDFRNMDFEKDGIYKRIEFAIQDIVDICFLINSGLRLGIPEEEEDVIDNLEKNNIMSKKILDIIREMRKFRNILVHRYGKINDKKAYESIREGLKDFESIVNEIEKFLKKRGKEGDKKK